MLSVKSGNTLKKTVKLDAVIESFEFGESLTHDSAVMSFEN